ncbi:tRNA synthetases class I, catalytic domain-containing protein [Mycena epipterygia]|nr:tRNA synthetases class I, catalytic domain-containing protein [Mycena epipterygia]
MNHLDSLDPFQCAIIMLVGAKSGAMGAKKAAAGFALVLHNTTQGNMVTRFPPEPSSYLYIGHAKAIILNQYFANMYNDKLFRFDNTNPSKRSFCMILQTEFEETILEDLRLLNAGDSVTHTSDYFDQLHDYAVQLIQSGKAYADDTDATTRFEQDCSCSPKSHGKLTRMAHERFHGIPSSRRDASREEGELGPDEAKWCLRAKISVDNPNKALRDLVIPMQFNPHHRTVYPTHDFACPVVDSIEGATHALRTNECRDRNLQYHWMIEALGIWPAVLSLEWDSLWALNKKIIDPKTPRFCAIHIENRYISRLFNCTVIVHLANDQVEPYTKPLPKHKKNPDIGTKLTTYSNEIVVEQVNAASFDVGEEGNVIVRSKFLAADGTVSSITVDLHLDGDFKATKNITWLAQSSDRPLVQRKLEDGDNWEDFITPKTEFREEALADANVLDLIGDGKDRILQFERKGYYSYDDTGTDGRLAFIKIPDGRTASLASKACR